MTDEDFVNLVRTSTNVAEVLRRLRELQQLTLHEVADLAGVSKAYVTRLEHGQRVPERDTLLALLLAAFGLPVSRANRVLLLAGYMPLHHKMLAKSA